MTLLFPVKPINTNNICVLFKSLVVCFMGYVMVLLLWFPPSQIILE